MSYLLSPAAVSVLGRQELSSCRMTQIANLRNLQVAKNALVYGMHGTLSNIWHL